MRILRAAIWACDDCTMYLCNGDLSGVDDDARVKRIENGCDAQGPHIVPNFDSEARTGMQTECYDGECDFCGIDDAVNLHRFAELGEGPEELDHDGAREYPIVNPSDHDRSYRTSLYCMWAGAYGDTRVYIWANSFEDAFEHLTEWLDDNAPGLLCKIDWDQTASDHGYEDWDAAYKALGEGDELDALVQEAETDLSIVGHTTLKNGDAIASWEWGGNEVTDEALVEAVRLLSV